MSGITKEIATQRMTTIGEMRALTGAGCRKIAEKLGIHYATVANYLKKDDVKELIDNHQKYIASFAPFVAQKFIDLCFSPNEEIATKNIAQYQKAMGIVGTQTSFFIQNVQQDNRVINYEPHIQQIIDNQVQDAIDGEIIEVKE
jgi:predicted transcriptional regulator